MAYEIIGSAGPEFDLACCKRKLEQAQQKQAELETTIKELEEHNRHAMRRIKEQAEKIEAQRSTILRRNAELTDQRDTISGMAKLQATNAKLRAVVDLYPEAREAIMTVKAMAFGTQAQQRWLSLASRMNEALAALDNETTEEG